MKTNLLFTLFLIPFFISAQNELISHFAWDSDPTSIAEVGPNASSISTSAYSDSLGVNNTNGLNAGRSPKQDINLVLPGSFFDVDGIEISIDYNRKENTGYFFTRGNSLRFGMTSGRLRIQYRLNDGNGSYIQYTYTNIYDIPFDNKYRNYSFSYNHNTGEAVVKVDTTVVWSKIESGEPLYWVAAGDMIIGEFMDGNGDNETTLDNAKIYKVLDVVLPVTYLSLSITDENDFPKLFWETSNEKNNSHFLIEKSYDGKDFETISKLEGNGDSKKINKYEFVDLSYLYGQKTFYRLNQVDKEGKSSYSKTLTFDKNILITEIQKVYPSKILTNNEIINIDFISTESSFIDINLYDLNSKLVSSKKQKVNKGLNIISLDSKIETKGIYILVIDKNQEIFTHKVIY